MKDSLEHAHTRQTDPRPAFASAVATATGVVGAVKPDHLALPTPCSEYDVEALLAHMTVVLRRVAALGEGTDPMAMPQVVTGVNPDGWLATFEALAIQAQRAWSDDETLDRMMTVPWAERPGRQMLSTYTPELTVHTWDLARALGVDVEWDTATIEAGRAAAETSLPPSPRAAFTPPNGMTAPFDDPIEIAVDAAPIDHLVAFYGRGPGWPQDNKYIDLSNDVDQCSRFHR